MVQYEVLKEKWHGELHDALAKDDNGSEELDRFLNPPYCTNNNAMVGLSNEKDSIEVQQQLTFAKIEAQVLSNRLRLSIQDLIDWKFVHI